MNSKPSYNYGSAARKLDYVEIKKENNKKIIRKKIKHKKKINVSSTVSVAIVFALAMLIVYRFNVISEKNLMVIDLKKDLTKQESNIASKHMNNYKNINLLEVESYAKQKLGMQKPDKNQVVYVDTMTSLKSRNSLDNNFFMEFIEMIKQYINM